MKGTVWIGKVCVLAIAIGTDPSFFLEKLSCDPAVDALDEADGPDPAVGPLEKVGVDGESLMGDIGDAKSLESDESFVRFFFRKPNVGMGWQKAEHTAEVFWQCDTDVIEAKAGSPRYPTATVVPECL